MSDESDTERAGIRERIAAAHARNRARGQALTRQVAETAGEAKDGVSKFAKEHPYVTVAGGVVLGIAIASLFKGPRRAGAAAGAKASGLASLGSEMVMAFARQAMDAAGDAGRAGGERLEDLGDAVGDKARHVQRAARYRAGEAGDTARTLARDVGKTIARSFLRH